MKLWETNWALLDLLGKKRPWRVQKFKRNLYTGDVQLLRRPRFFKTEASAEKAILKMDEARKKIWEEKRGSSSGGGEVTPAQRELANARSKTRRKWFPDTTAVLEQMEQTGRTEEHDQTLRKALISDLARLQRTPPDEIKNAVPLDKDFTAVLAKARTSSNPLDPMEEELALNWLAKYSGEVYERYEEVMKEATGIKYSNAAIRKRAQRMGLHVVK